jgi:carboxyl-terminal processing protease
VASVDDPWSFHLTAEEERELSGVMEHFVGIGFTFNHRGDGGLIVTDVYADSPAEESGIRTGDRLISINGKPTAGLPFELAQAMIQGEENTPVSLGMIRAADGEAYEVRPVRRLVAQDAVSAEILEGGIGYIRIRSFDGGVTLSFRSAAANLQNAGIEGLIIDVRENPGGPLNEMLPILDFILPEGSNLLFTRSKTSADAPPYRSTASSSWEIPMIVLVGRGTYGSAEYFAAALQEYNWAGVMGAQTAGKGYEKVPIKLSDGSALLLSTHEYLTPQGISLAGTGVRPDVTISAEAGASQVLRARGLDETLRIAGERMRHQIEELRRQREEDENRVMG